jgi:hypothetical protein
LPHAHSPITQPHQDDVGGRKGRALKFWMEGVYKCDEEDEEEEKY